MTTVGRPPSLARVSGRGTFATLIRTPTVVIGGCVVLLWVVVAIAWPMLVLVSPDRTDPLSVLAPPSGQHWLGTDHLGRDVFSRVLAGSTSVLVMAPLATLVGLVLGTIIGVTAGYFRGWWDMVVMRVLESVLIVPVILIAMTVLALFGSSRLNVILTVGILFTPHIARTVRSAVLVERHHEYVAASWLQGSSSVYTMCGEILRNVTGPIIVEATVRLGYAIFVAAGLAFLSLGVQEPSPDWGLTISLGRPYVQSAPWMVLAPAAALTTLVIAVNLLADGVKEVLEQ
ncbi:peptide/nickel transport system permease protein [Micromonospora olivasterospora]|uniref:Peptide/nickel transport system permease protein n=2 Tax=Micromonospora olivasterospora TaxID=1880 RepID=A0A562IJM7_MICOL|nr:peptide/nickel transport system permease protein [Micromonospora olivasterospora]